MTKESANTMLKFLEEPDGNVIGFFITNQKENVLLTIQSRCQHIEAIFENNAYEKYNIEEDKFNEYVEIINKYLESIEVTNRQSILNNKNFENYSKEEIKIMFQIILDIYETALKTKIIDEPEQLKYKFLLNNSVNKLKKKTELIIEILNEINYNVNKEMLLDRFLIEMEGINNEII